MCSSWQRTKVRASAEVFFLSHVHETNLNYSKGPYYPQFFAVLCGKSTLRLQARQDTVMFFIIQMMHPVLFVNHSTVGSCMFCLLYNMLFLHAIQHAFFEKLLFEKHHFEKRLFEKQIFTMDYLQLDDDSDSDAFIMLIMMSSAMGKQRVK